MRGRRSMSRRRGRTGKRRSFRRRSGSSPLRIGNRF